MNNNLKMIVIIILGIVALYIFQTKYSDHNLNKSISACILAQKQTLKSFDLAQAKKFCKEEVTKRVKN